jgi:hypothetical protein
MTGTAPHVEARKAIAMSLVGRDVRWAHDACGRCESMRVLSMTSDGLVTVSGFSGEFAPHLFVVVEELAR